MPVTDLQRDASKAAQGLIRREGPIGWLLVAQSTFFLLILIGFGVLLYELRDVHLASRVMQGELYQKILVLSRDAARQEAAARRELISIADESRQANAQTTQAVELLASAIKDRRTFDTLVFEEMKRGTEAIKSSERVLERLLRQVKDK